MLNFSITKPKINLKNALWDFFEVLFISISIVSLTFWFVGQPVHVSGDSMAPNLANNQQLIAEKLSYKLRPPERREIIILQHPVTQDHLLVKRIIGIPGDTFEIKNGKVYINDKPLNESYLSDETVTDGKNELRDNQKIEVPEGKYIVLGDNRENSMDSRNWGFVDENEIIGKTFMVYRPLSDFRILQQR